MLIHENGIDWLARPLMLAHEHSQKMEILVLGWELTTGALASTPVPGTLLTGGCTRGHSVKLDTLRTIGWSASSEGYEVLQQL